MSIDKVIKKTVTVNGKKVPYFVVPPGMSGMGVDLKKHFKDKSDDLDEGSDESDTSEELGFAKEFQKYCDTGETDDAFVEDFVRANNSMKYYDFKKDTNIELDKIIR